MLGEGVRAADGGGGRVAPSGAEGEVVIGGVATAVETRGAVETFDVAAIEPELSDFISVSSSSAVSFDLDGGGVAATVGDGVPEVKSFINVSKSSSPFVCVASADGVRSFISASNPSFSFGAGLRVEEIAACVVDDETAWVLEERLFGVTVGSVFATAAVVGGRFWGGTVALGAGVVVIVVVGVGVGVVVVVVVVVGVGFFTTVEGDSDGEDFFGSEEVVVDVFDVDVEDELFVVDAGVEGGGVGIEDLTFVTREGWGGCEGNDETDDVGIIELRAETLDDGGGGALFRSCINCSKSSRPPCVFGVDGDTTFCGAFWFVFCCGALQVFSKSSNSVVVKRVDWDCCGTAFLVSASAVRSFIRLSSSWRSTGEEGRGACKVEAPGCGLLRSFNNWSKSSMSSLRDLARAVEFFSYFNCERRH
jgi:hypothetical protein